MHFASFDVVHQFSCIAQTTHGTGTYYGVAKLEVCFATVSSATYIKESIHGRFFTFNHCISGTQSCFHNATGYTENYCRTSAATQRAVKFCRFKACYVDVFSFNQASQFASGEYDVNVRYATATHGEQCSFTFFRYARHNGDGADVFSINAFLLSEVSFSQSTKDLLRRLSAGKVGEERRITFAYIAYPTRAAGGEHRPRMFIFMSQAFQKFTAFFHNGNVCRKVGVEYIIKANLFQSCNHHTFSELFRCKTKCFAPSSTNCGSNLYNGNLVGICQYFEDFGNIVTFFERANGAMSNALTAQAAIGLSDIGESVGNIYGSATTGVYQVPDIQALHFVTNLDATHAFDTFFRISNQGEFFIPRDIDNVFFVGQFKNAKVICQSLECAVTATYAGCTQAIVLGKDEFYVSATYCTHFRRVSINNDVFLYGSTASSYKFNFTLNFYYANFAGTDFVNAFQIAQAGNADTNGVRSLHDCCTFRSSYFLSVNC